MGLTPVFRSNGFIAHDGGSDGFHLTYLSYPEPSLHATWPKMDFRVHLCDGPLASEMATRVLMGEFGGLEARLGLGLW